MIRNLKIEFERMPVRLREFGRSFIHPGLIFGLVFFILALVLVFPGGVTVPFNLGFWKWDEEIGCFVSYTYSQVLLALLYPFWALQHLRFYFMDSSYTRLLDHDNTYDSWSGNRSIDVLLVGASFGLGYYFLHQWLTDGASFLPILIQMFLQGGGYFAPSGQLDEPARRIFPMIEVNILLIATLFIYGASGLPK
jgi:hypothetical protein